MVCGVWLSGKRGGSPEVSGFLQVGGGRLIR